MRVLFCDICGKEMEYTMAEEIEAVSHYRHVFGYRDVCKKCLKKIKKAISKCIKEEK